MFGKTNDGSFAELFEKHIANTITCAGKLYALFKNLDNVSPYIQSIVELEHKGDGFAREVHLLLDRTYITRIDKGDIVNLINELDHIIDFMKATAVRVDIFRITKTRSEALPFVQVILAMTQKLKELICELSAFQPEPVREHVVKIKEFEEKADLLLHQALKNLFLDEADIKTLIGWKDIFEMLENVTDHCEDVANVISSIVRKEAR